MAATQQGSAVIFGISAASGTPATFTVYDASGTTLGAGYVSPIITGANVNHSAEVDTIKSDSGEVVAVIGHGEFLEATFECIPSGTTVANARKAAVLPPLGATVITAGFDVIRMGPFADALNVAGGSPPENSRWIYMGGGSVRESSDGHATLSLPLKRYPGIVGGAAIID